MLSSRAPAGVAGAGCADDQVDALGDHRRTHVLERPQPAHAPVLGRALRADPSDDLVCAHPGRVELGDEVRRELPRADDGDPRLEAVLEVDLDPGAERGHEPGAEDNRLVLGRRVRVPGRERDQPGGGRSGDRGEQAEQHAAGRHQVERELGALDRLRGDEHAGEHDQSRAQLLHVQVRDHSGCGRGAEPEREPVDHPLGLERPNARVHAQMERAAMGAIQLDRVH